MIPCPKWKGTQEDKQKIVLFMLLYIVIKERKLILGNMKASVVHKPA